MPPEIAPTCLADTLAIVTGAGRGNGRAIANGLASAGAVVWGVDLGFESEEPFRQLTGDITDGATIQSVCDAAKTHAKHHLVLVNNAGVTFPCEGRYSAQFWHRTLAVNLTAPFLWMEEFAEVFRTTGSGCIINITSLAAERAFPNNPAYIASKAGLKMLTKYYARMLGPFHVRANNVGPGYIRTKMTRQSYDDPETRDARARHTFLGRWGEPADLAGVCVFLASPASAYVTGQDIYVDGGWTANGLIE